MSENYRIVRPLAHDSEFLDKFVGLRNRHSVQAWIAIVVREIWAHDAGTIASQLSVL